MIFKIRLPQKPAKEHPVVIADRARDAGDWPRAGQYYRETLDREPKRGPIWVQYGHALKEMGKRADAEAAYRTAIALEPQVADTHLQLGHVLKLQNKREDALAAYRQAMKLDPALQHAHDELLALERARHHFPDLARKLARPPQQRPATPVSVEGVWPDSIIGRKPERLAGTIEHWDGRQASGWLFDSTLAGQPLTKIEIVADGKTIGHQPVGPRGDLLQAGEAGWAAAFESDVQAAGQSINPCELETVAWAGNESCPGPGLSHPARRTVIASPYLDTFVENVLVVPAMDIAGFRNRLGPNPRICICAMWAAGERLQRHQQALLREIRRLGFAIVVVNSSLTAGREAMQELRNLSDLLILREQGGRDFASWILGLGILGESATGCAQMLLCNDSCIGPLVPLDGIFAEMAGRGADVWGITDSWDRNFHLQSYFLVFSGQAVRSRAFWQWACKYTMSDDRQTIIDEGEIALSSYLSQAGLKLAAYCEYNKVISRWLEKHAAQSPALAVPKAAMSAAQLQSARARRFHFRVARKLMDGVPLNSTHWFWDILVEDFGSPFIKKGLLIHNPDRIQTWERIPDVARRLGIADQLDDLWTQAAPATSGIGAAVLGGEPLRYPITQILS